MVESGSKGSSRTKSPKKHWIRDGDTLASLADRYLGDPERADEILAANQSVLEDPEVLPIGAEIVIPRGKVDGTGLVDQESNSPEMVPLPKDNF